MTTTNNNTVIIATRLTLCADVESLVDGIEVGRVRPTESWHFRKACGQLGLKQNSKVYGKMNFFAVKTATDEQIELLYDDPNILAHSTIGAYNSAVKQAQAEYTANGVIVDGKIDLSNGRKDFNAYERRWQQLIALKTTVVSSLERTPDKKTAFREKLKKQSNGPDINAVELMKKLRDHSAKMAAQEAELNKRTEETV